ncbi:class I SAM-dependent methyltransferase [Herbivorax sp. ANBcel31]|uniref:class I SAM-dependent methyltransferase n=1 Tax=Herbivorax sp. ANBcel31 TaxID=3069754 RepID=UPI0027AFE3BC|nr:class I SAM-dependent methyltransferase [Herbivorax sp. ANBcel31]MDQ2085622.1 class I SAM-dependent methyltransferase [Herbivorax sp. ANBcel31]
METQIIETAKSVKCPICNGTTNKFIGLPAIPQKFINYIRKEYKSFYCKNCNYYFVSPSIDLTENEWSNMYAEGYFCGFMTKWWKNKRFKERNRVIKLFKSFSLINGTKFLEIGCGEGYMLIDSNKTGWNVYGIDVSDNRINEARNNRINFEVGNLLEKNYESESFDFVYMDSVLEHVPDPVKYMDEIKRILKKDGLLYLAVPNENALILKFRTLVFKLIGKKTDSASFKPFKHPYHINGFTKKSLLEILKNNKFSVLKYRNYAGWYEFLKYEFLSKGFIKNALLLPVHILAIPLRMQFYQDVICIKK